MKIIISPTDKTVIIVIVCFKKKMHFKNTFLRKYLLEDYKINKNVEKGSRPQIV